jgi:hypothetical protein
MKKLFCLLILFSITQSFAQTRVYEFETMDRRLEEGWQVIPNKGEVQLDDKFIRIITEQSVYEFEIKSKSYWLTDDSFMFGCTDWQDRYVNIRMVVNPNLRLNSKWLDFYLYFDGKVFEYYRLCLNKCEY